jgi:serine/threonine-protein phosphatase 5
MDGLKLTFRRRPKPLPPIPLDLHPHTLSLLLTHRSLLHALLNNPTSSLRDATSALSFDPNNSLALLHRANAHYSLGNFTEASNDYLLLSTRESLPRSLTSRIIPSIDDFTARIDSIQLPIPLPGGLTLDLFTSADARSLMYQMRDGTLPPTEMIHSMLERSRVMHSVLPNIVFVDIPEIKVVGDTHGQFQDLIFIFETFGFPSASNRYLFNGDYVDRGSQGVEIVLTLLAFKIADPESIFLNRGNQYSFIFLIPVNLMQ